MRDLTTYLPDPEYKTRTLAVFQSTEDIAKAVLLAEYDSRIYAGILEEYFHKPGRSLLEDLKGAYDYAIKKIVYKAERDPQSVKTLPKLLRDGFGDCKHFATFMGSVCYALGIDYFFRLTSYNKFVKTPTHIYICIVVKGKVIPVDPVYKIFGGEKGYVYKWDYKPLI